MIDYISAYKSQIASMGFFEADKPKMKAELTVIMTEL